MFFFEKKNQKTFASLQRDSTNKSFLVLFFKKGLLASCLLLAAAAPPVTVRAPWARASLPQQATSVAYMVLHSAAPDALTGVTAMQGMAMLHQSTQNGGMAGMADMENLKLPAGQDVALAPGGAHIMLMDLPRAVRAGETLRLTLHFAHAPDQNVAVPVRPSNAVGP